MLLKIFHTSDVHLGIKFEGYPDAVRESLIEARFGTLKRIVDMANETGCDLLVVAGDLFHKVSVAQKTVIRAAQILKEFQGKAIAVLPGNHDYLSHAKVDLWTVFKQAAGDHVILLEKQAARSLASFDLNVNLYPAPCDAMHSESNCIGWVKDTLKDPAVAWHIGIAHGSLEGVSPDLNSDYYPMTAAELTGVGLDLWLLGHTHLSYPPVFGSRDRIFYPSTPEPDGFDCDHAGMAWIIELDEAKQVKAERVRTGMYRFVHAEAEVNSMAEIEALRREYESGDFEKELLKLKVHGRLSKEDRERLNQAVLFIKKRLFHIEIDDSGVEALITAEDINRDFAEQSFPHVLLNKFMADKDQEALQIAYEFLREERQ